MIEIIKIILLIILFLIVSYTLIRVLSSGVFRSYFETKKKYEKGTENGQGETEEKRKKGNVRETHQGESETDL